MNLDTFLLAFSFRGSQSVGPIDFSSRQVVRHTMARVFGGTKQPAHQEPESKKEDKESGLSSALLKVRPLMAQGSLYRAIALYLTVKGSATLY